MKHAIECIRMSDSEGVVDVNWVYLKTYPCTQVSTRMEESFLIKTYTCTKASTSVFCCCTSKNLEMSLPHPQAPPPEEIKAWG